MQKLTIWSFRESWGFQPRSAPVPPATKQEGNSFKRFEDFHEVKSQDQIMSRQRERERERERERVCLASMGGAGRVVDPILTALDLTKYNMMNRFQTLVSI